VLPDPRRAMRKIIRAAVGMCATSGIALTLATAGPLSTARANVASPHHPSPTHFTEGRVTNKWFPLRPGTVFVYRGREDGARSRDVVRVTRRTRVVDGVRCRVVSDRLYLDGLLRERTHDYYAQTKRGTVWYFGEATAELDRHGHVTSREGSFLSGRHGAEAGIFMPAHPRVGTSYRQEDYPGHAEDQFTVKSLDAFVRTPVVTSRHALLTRETSPLEPGVVDHKWYVRGVGNVKERTVRGGNDFQRLVRIRHR
jgi:hypothetical protein